MTETAPLRRSFRLVCQPDHIPLVEALLEAQGFVFEPEPFSPLARRLLEEPFPLGGSLAAIWGFLYIQDRSSMLPPLALAPEPGARVLDCCASPGSKTGLLAQLVGPRGLVLGNEPTKPRLATLRRNLAALNLFQTVTCSWPGEALPMPDASWDCILLDPPCSGWGTTDKHPQAVRMWQGERLKPLIDLQRMLLARAARLLKPGGRMVYSTCTTNVDENEAQVRFAVEELGLELQPLQPFPGFVFGEPELRDCEGTLRVDEDASGAQGFYIACLGRPKTDAAASENPGNGEMPSSQRGTGKGSVRMRGSEKSGALASRQTIPPSMLRESGLSPERLPPGELAVFNGTIHFLPEQALSLPESIRWQGMALGKAGIRGPNFSTRLHALVDPESAVAARLQLDEIPPIEALLQGRSLETGLSGRVANLFWRDLPLGQVRLKSGRALL